MDTRKVCVKGSPVPRWIYDMIKGFGNEPWKVLKNLFIKHGMSSEGRKPGFGCTPSHFFKKWSSSDRKECLECLIRPHYVDPRRVRSAVPVFLCFECAKSKLQPRFLFYLLPLFDSSEVNKRIAEIRCLKIAEKFEAETKDIPEEHRCLLCFSKKRSVVLNPCRHLCLCHGCYDEMESMKDKRDPDNPDNPHGLCGVYEKCPVCRGIFTGFELADPGVAGEYFI